MELNEVEKQLREWLSQMKYRKGDHWSPYIKRENDIIRVRLFTDRNVYGIVAKPTYLGAMASSSKPRVGEDWTRGNDLADGPFNHDTWVKILSDIVSYELVNLAPGVKNAFGEVEKKPSLLVTKEEVK